MGAWRYRWRYKKGYKTIVRRQRKWKWATRRAFKYVTKWTYGWRTKIVYKMVWVKKGTKTKPTPRRIRKRFRVRYKRRVRYRQRYRRRIRYRQRYYNRRRRRWAYRWRYRYVWAYRWRYKNVPAYKWVTKYVWIGGKKPKKPRKPRNPREEESEKDSEEDTGKELNIVKGLEEDMYGDIRLFGLSDTSTDGSGLTSSLRNLFIERESEEDTRSDTERKSVTSTDG